MSTDGQNHLAKLKIDKMLGANVPVKVQRKVAMLQTCKKHTVREKQNPQKGIDLVKKND